MNVEKPIDIIKQLGKKYTNLPEAKQQRAKAEIQKLAQTVSYDELQPLFHTARKKTGTRIATIIALGILLENGQERNDEINVFIDNATKDDNSLLVTEAKLTRS